MAGNELVDDSSRLFPIAREHVIDGDLRRQPARRLLESDSRATCNSILMQLGCEPKLPQIEEDGGEISGGPQVIRPADAARNVAARLEIRESLHVALSCPRDADAVQHVRAHVVAAERLGHASPCRPSATARSFSSASIAKRARVAST
jgi:hypothetical protein